MRTHQRGSVGNDIVALVIDHVLGDHGTRNRRDAENINSCGPRSSSIVSIRAVERNIVAYDDVVVEVLTGRVAMHGNAGQSVVSQAIIDDHVAVIRGAGNGVKDADSSTCPFDSRSISRRYVSGDRIVGDA